MQQVNDFLTLHPPRRGLTEVIGEIAAWLAGQPLRERLLTLFLRHTSASLVIQENADADVQRNLEAFLDKLVPKAFGRPIAFRWRAWLPMSRIATPRAPGRKPWETVSMGHYQRSLV